MPTIPKAHIILRDHLDTANGGITELHNADPSRNLFATPPIPEHDAVPGIACFVWEDGGVFPKSTKDRKFIARPTIRVLFRGAKEGYNKATGVDLAERLWYRLHDSRPTGLMLVDCQQSRPNFLGRHHGRFEWSIPVTAMLGDSVV